MIPYIISKGDNIIECNSDLIITDTRGYLLFLSLFDYGIKNKKICSDIYRNKYFSIDLKDREDVNFGYNIYISNDHKYSSRSEKQDIYTHTILKRDDINNFIINWNNEDLGEYVVNYIRNKLYIPITKEIFEDIDGYNLLEELNVFTSNLNFKNLKAYYINSYWLKEKLKNYKNESCLNDNFNWNEIESIQDYIFKFINPIKNKLSETITPLFNPNSIDNNIFNGKMKPLKSQIPIIQSGLEVLKRNKFLFIGAEQGCGKTLMGSKINHNYFKSINNNKYTTLIVAPAITLTQWKEEIKNSFDDKVNIIIIKKTSDFIKWYKNNKKYIPTYLLIGKETFKLGYALTPSYNKRKTVVEEKTLDNFYKRYSYKEDYMYTIKKVLKDVLVCPCCGVPLKKPNRNEDIFFVEKDFNKPNKGNYKCQNCKTPLWSAYYNKTKKTSVIDYIHRKNIIFDSVIIDEAHESNNSGSIIGNSTRTLLRNHCKKAIALSGTNNNGYASSLHNLFMAIYPNKLKEDNCLDVKDFVNKYGTLQAITNVKDEKRTYYNRGKAEIKDSEFKEIEGINPIVFTKYLSSNYIFASLEIDIPIHTNYIPIEATEEQRTYTNNLMNDIKKANSFNAKMYNDTIIKHYLNNPVEWDNIEIEFGDRKEIVKPKNLYPSILPKEQKLLDIIKQEYSEGRKVWIYCEFNNGGNYMKEQPLPKRIKSIIEKEGLKVYELLTSTSTYDRKEIIEKNKDKYDVFICNPRLVNVGINLTFCPTYIFFMPSYRVDIVSQASRRGYRANSTMENRIYHLYYKDTIEEDIIERFQRKLAESNAINGKFNVDLEDKNKIRTASQFSSKINENM